MPIVIVPPRDSWRLDYQVLKAVLASAAPSGSSFHHIGSTAVTGLAAKDVIDVQVTVDDLDRLDDAAFEQVGFETTAIRDDHCPPALELCARELRKRFYRAQDRPANVHVRERGRFNQRYALVCRDFLRARPTAAAAYVSIKRQLADLCGDDRRAYDEVKDPIFDIMVEGANAWAELTGWTEPASD